MTQPPSATPPSDSPSPRVRVLVGVLLGAAILLLLLPVVLALLGIFVASIVFGAAIALDHTGLHR